MDVLLALDPSWPDPPLPLGHHTTSRCDGLDLDDLSAAIVDAEVLVVRGTPLPRSVIERAGRLRLVQKTGAGFDKIDVGAATARGLPVSTTPGANAISVAEHALSLMLYLARSVEHQRASLSAGQWRDLSPALPSLELYEATLGIVGLGAVGIELARRARAFQMRLLASSRSPKPEVERELGIERTSLSDLLRQSDFVVLACPLNPQTRHVIDAAALAQMKPTAYLINIARGQVIDEPALIEALRCGQIAGAGLDVFDPEPPSTDNPLLTMRNVIATPHIAGSTADGQRRTWQLVVENLDRVERRERPLWVVNPEVFDTR